MIYCSVTDNLHFFFHSPFLMLQKMLYQSATSVQFVRYCVQCRSWQAMCFSNNHYDQFKVKNANIVRNKNKVSNFPQRSHCWGQQEKGGGVGVLGKCMKPGGGGEAKDMIFFLMLLKYWQ